MIYAPGVRSGTVLSYTEHVDLWPTLAELATGRAVSPCPSGAALLATAVCTMGRSLAPIMRSPAAAGVGAAFSQYPRSYCENISRSNPNPNCWPRGADRASPARGVGAGGAAGPGGAEVVGWRASPSPCFERCTMGYSMVTQVGGREYRYTEWVDFGTVTPLAPDWGRLVGVEMYDHGTAASSGVAFEENANVADDPQRAAVRTELHERLK
eukprot:SAG11_NODE_10840_length_802_cov_1.297297_1_plen_210_part_01